MATAIANLIYQFMINKIAIRPMAWWLGRHIVLESRPFREYATMLAHKHTAVPPMRIKYFTAVSVNPVAGPFGGGRPGGRMI